MNLREQFLFRLIARQVIRAAYRSRWEHVSDSGSNVFAQIAAIDSTLEMIRHK